MSKPIKTFVVGPLRATIHEVKHKRGNQEVTTYTVGIQLKDEERDGGKGFWVPYGPFVEAAFRKAIDFLVSLEWEEQRKRTARTARGKPLVIL